MTDWIIAFLTYGIFIPSSWLCMFPVRKYLKWNIPFVRLMLYTTITFLLFTVLLSRIPLQNADQIHLIFNIIFIICGILYLFAFRIQKGILIYLFAFMFCILSCATLLSYYWDAYRNPTSNSSVFSIESGLSQWVAAVLISVLFMILFGRRLEWMIDHFRDEKVWIFMSAPSWVIALCTVLMVPNEYANLFVGRIFSVSVHATLTLVFLFILTQMIFYSLTRSSYDRSAMEQENQLMALQLRQIELQSSYITETHRLRHDFKHSVVALSSLLQEGKINEALEYLTRYNSSITPSQEYIEFCYLPALNALLNEYIRQATEKSIRIHHSINIPEQLNLDEPQLCVLVGNLLNNAIHACEKIPKDHRFIKIYIDTESDRQLYLIFQNSYDGKLILKESAPVDIPQGHYGISSVKTIAEEYKGVARFYTEDMTFYAEIMLPITKKPIA